MPHKRTDSSQRIGRSTVPSPLQLGCTFGPVDLTCESVVCIHCSYYPACYPPMDFDLEYVVYSVCPIFVSITYYLINLAVLWFILSCTALFWCVTHYTLTHAPAAEACCVVVSAQRWLVDLAGPRVLDTVADAYPDAILNAAAATTTATDSSIASINSSAAGGATTAGTASSEKGSCVHEDGGKDAIFELVQPEVCMQ